MTAPKARASLEELLIAAIRDPSGYEVMDLEQLLKLAGYTQRDDRHWVHQSHGLLPSKQIPETFRINVPPTFVRDFSERLLEQLRARRLV